MNKKFKPIRELAKEINAIIRRPAPQESIDKFNKIMDEEERLKKENTSDRSDKKIAQSPETEA